MAIEVKNINKTFKSKKTDQLSVLSDINLKVEKGEIDTSKLTAKMLWSAVSYPMGQVVQDYEGNQVLMHVNTGCAYIGTVYMYSNFEMTDVVMIGDAEETWAEMIKDYENGKLKKVYQKKLKENNKN